MNVCLMQSHMTFNFWELNNPNQQTWIEILSNRVLYQNLKDNNPDNDPPFAYNLNHVVEEIPAEQ